VQAVIFDRGLHRGIAGRCPALHELAQLGVDRVGLAADRLPFRLAILAVRRDGRTRPISS
jgi:hypothetical protein